MLPIFAHAYSHRMMKSFKCDEKYEEMAKSTQGKLNGKIRKALMNKVIYFKGQKAFSAEDGILLKYSRNQIGCCLENSSKNRADIIVTFMIDKDQYVYINPPTGGATILFEKNNQDINKERFFEEVFGSEVEAVTSEELEEQIFDRLNEYPDMEFEKIMNELYEYFGSRAINEELVKILYDQLKIAVNRDPEAVDIDARRKAMFRPPGTRPPLNIDNVTDLSFETRQLVCDILDNLPEDRTFILNGESKKLSEDEKTDVRNFIDFYRKYEVDQDREDEDDMISVFNASDEAVQNLILRVSEFKEILGPVNNLVRQLSEVTVEEDPLSELEQELLSELKNETDIVSCIDCDTITTNRVYRKRNNNIRVIESDGGGVIIRSSDDKKAVYTYELLDSEDLDNERDKTDDKPPKKNIWVYDKEKIKSTTEECKTNVEYEQKEACLLYTSPSPRDQRGSRMPSSA